MPLIEKPLSVPDHCQKDTHAVCQLAGHSGRQGLPVPAWLAKAVVSAMTDVATAQLLTGSEQPVEGPGNCQIVGRLYIAEG